jgi:hypothetical protein
MEFAIHLLSTDDLFSIPADLDLVLDPPEPCVKLIAITTLDGDDGVARILLPSVVNG